MSVKCQNIIDILEQLAPKYLAEEWDNVGLQVGDPRSSIKKVLITLDLTGDVVHEAIEQRVDMIITHHPLIFKPLRNIRWDLDIGSLIKKIIEHGIHVYSVHTNLDKAESGLNDMLAERLSLEDTQVLSPSNEERLYKFVVFVPQGYESNIRDALASQGAGWIGDYSHCTFSTQGIGTFKPLEGTKPFLGEMGKLEYVDELRVETIISSKNLSKTIKAVLRAHPYEEVAYDIYPLENHGQEFGLGRIGMLDQPLAHYEFLNKIKRDLNIQHLRIAGEPKNLIKKVAICAGSGAEFIHKAAMLVPMHLSLGI